MLPAPLILQTGRNTSTMSSPLSQMRQDNQQRDGRLERNPHSTTIGDCSDRTNPRTTSNGDCSDITCVSVSSCSMDGSRDDMSTLSLPPCQYRCRNAIAGVHIDAATRPPHLPCDVVQNQKFSQGSSEHSGIYFMGNEIPNCLAQTLKEHPLVRPLPHVATFGNARVPQRLEIRVKTMRLKEHLKRRAAERRIIRSSENKRNSGRAVNIQLANLQPALSHPYTALSSPPPLINMLDARAPRNNPQEPNDRLKDVLDAAVALTKL